ncbi:ATP-grasp domain-containing protein [Lacticaseibacillus daqingensis]|uniref:ATP-grasp domain-containing protein n=1 Tax=Lacticaseibacillus daqingensis TaxID=2486014 RepID=UPI000F79F529|nr:ATP-grasp domain-containing protein [Lacticaseibacillus daqingensis]
MTEFIRPGAVLGIIGGGVRAYRLVAVAKQLGLNTVVLASDPKDIALEVADMAVTGAAQDAAALARVAEVATVITYMDENVDGDALAELTTARQLPSGVDILAVTQDRYLEKVFLDDLNMNILPYAQVVTAGDITKAIESVGFPAILKPIQKGIGADQQLLLRTPEDVTRAAAVMAARPYVLEAWLESPREFAVAVAKSEATIRVMPVVQTVFANHELQAAVVPATGGIAVTHEIERIARVIAQRLSYTGVFGVELFLAANQTLYVKRVFPGPQLSGHVLAPTAGRSLDELHLRALLGWPLPEVTVRRPGALVPLREADRAAAMTQLQIKPDWQFQFYPSGAALVGELALFGGPATVQQALDATDHFHLTL